MIRNHPTLSNQPFGIDAEDYPLDSPDYENDSDLDDEIPIDESGNVLEHNGPVRYESSTMAHILAGYGTDICEQLIAQFIKQELNCKQLSLLTDKDLEMLGVSDVKIRTQMLSEFNELPNQEIPKEVLESNASDQHQLNDVVLRNVYKHLNCLKTSLSVVLLRLYVQPTVNVLINDHTYASEFVLKTLDEFTQTVVNMEKRLMQLQSGNCQQLVKTKSKKRFTIWLSMATGMFSVGGYLILRYLNAFNRFH